MTEVSEEHFSYRIVAYAGRYSFILNGDDEFVPYPKCDGKPYKDLKDAHDTFNLVCTQNAANKFSAHLEVTFALIEDFVSKEGEVFTEPLINLRFEVKEA